MVTITAEKLRKVRRIAANVGFGLLVYVIALYVWFPYQRAKEYVISLAATQDLDVEIGGAGPALGLAVKFSDIKVATRPAPGSPGKPTRVTIDSARVSLSSLSLDAFGGQI